MSIREIGIQEFVSKILEREGPIPFRLIIQEIEDEFVRQALGRANGNVARAARRLKIRPESMHARVASGALHNLVDTLRTPELRARALRVPSFTRSIYKHESENGQDFEFETKRSA